MKRFTLLSVFALVVALLAPPARAAATPASEQLSWFVDMTHRVPVPDDEIRAHVASSVITALHGPAGVNYVLGEFGPLTLDRIVAEQPGGIQAQVHGTDVYLASLGVDAAGLINGLRMRPNDPPPTSWPELESQVKGLGARVSFAASEIRADGSCRVARGVNQDVQRPLGSAFKLYVLGALGRAVAQHRASWTEQLAIRDDWKSLPSGDLQNQPAGTKLPLSEYADKMISISDNTAADHLIHRLGRDEVERQLRIFGNQRPEANIPFLTTKALFELKGIQYPARADAYLALPRWARPAALAGLERQPLAGITGWAQPEKIDQLEWFGSPTDICRVFSGLRKENQPEVDYALSIEDGALNLDRAQYPTVWYKGGSEPGVLTLNYLARTARGRTFVTSVMVSDPAAALVQNHVFALGAAVATGAVSLLTLGS